MNACGRGEKVKRDPLYLKIYNDLLAGIKNGTYASGSRLPSEKELSSNYDVSRITSKKALEMLAEQNMITRMPGKGSYVSYSGERVDEILIERQLEGKKVIWCCLWKPAGLRYRVGMPGAGLLYDAAVYLRKRGGGGESY